MKRILALLLALLLCLTACSNISEAEKDTKKETRPGVIEREPDEDPEPERRYAASSESDKYHRLSCRYVDKIKSYNIVYYSSESEARADGKKPCSVCNP